MRKATLTPVMLLQLPTRVQEQEQQEEEEETTLIQARSDLRLPRQITLLLPLLPRKPPL
jgi:hypothetical protein